MPIRRDGMSLIELRDVVKVELRKVERRTKYRAGTRAGWGACEASNKLDGSDVCLAGWLSVAGFDGDHCELNVDDCRNNRCANHATCVDAVHSYVCSCPPQWQGAL